MANWSWTIDGKQVTYDEVVEYIDKFGTYYEVSIVFQSSSPQVSKWILIPDKDSQNDKVSNVSEQ